MTVKDNYSLRRSELVKTEADFLESSQLRICTRSLDAGDEREAGAEELLPACPNGMGLAKTLKGLRKGVWEGVVA